MQSLIEFFLSLIGEASTGRMKPIVPWLDKAIWLILAALLFVSIVLYFILVP